MKKAILFDWNGTLFDDTAIWFDAAKEPFRVFGIEPPSLDEYIRGFTGDYRAMYDSRGITASLEEINKIHETHYESRMGEPVLSKNARYVLKTLSRRKVLTGVITAQQEHLVWPLFKKFRIFYLLHFWSFQTQDKQAKLLNVCEANVIKRENCYYVGDSPSDIRHAKKAGVKAVAFLGGYMPEDLMYAERPDFVIRDLSEVLNLEHAWKPHSGSADSDFGLQHFVSASKYHRYSSASDSRLVSKSETSAQKRVSRHAP